MTNWFERQRHEWIAEMLHIYGFINRHHLMRKFGISKPQASNDLTAFQHLHPDAMSYDIQVRCYRAADRFEHRAALAHGNPEPGSRKF